MLVPGSLAIISSSFEESDRGRAIGAWSGLSGVTTAVGPFVGGWLVDSVSWRLVFFINLPLALVAIVVALKHVPETADPHSARRPDVAGGLAASVGLGGLVFALIEGPARGWSSGLVVSAAVIGGVFLFAFLLIEARRDDPMMPFSIFRSRQFSAANATTLLVYGALGAAMFLLVLQLQKNLHYSALEAGAALIPLTLLLLALSPTAGRVAQRLGPRGPMTVGPIVAAAGIGLMAGIERGGGYVADLLPGVVIFGLGMAVTVAPLTTAVLAAVEASHAGLASGINNAVARLAGLLAVVLIPLAAGISGIADVGGVAFSLGFRRSLLIAAVVCGLGGVISFVGIRNPRSVVPAAPPAHDQPPEAVR